MRLFIAAALIALPASGFAYAGNRTAPVVMVTEVPSNCPLTLSFGSYAMGIDSAAFERVIALLVRDRGVTRVEQYRWGREGELTLCARTRGAADAGRLFRAIRATLPRHPRGPVTISSGRTIFTSPRR